MTIDANHLTYLLAIARTGSFSRAAIELGQSQPTLSNNIAILEKRLGVKVLERSKRGSTLTPHGEILVRRAKGLASILDDAVSEIRNSELGINGPLRIGATPSTFPSLIPLALTMMGPMLNSASIELIEDLDHALAPQLVSGRLDIIVGPVFEQFMSNYKVNETELMRDPFCIGVSEDSIFANKKSINLVNILNENWILPLEGSTYRRHIESMFINQGVEWPKKAIYANSLPLIEALVTSGQCVTFVSPLQLQRPYPKIKLIEIINGASRKVGYKVRKNDQPSPLALKFIECLEAAGFQLKQEFSDLGLCP